jgi:hypothetical protein
MILLCGLRAPGRRLLIIKISSYKRIDWHRPLKSMRSRSETPRREVTINAQAMIDFASECVQKQASIPQRKACHSPPSRINVHLLRKHSSWISRVGRASVHESVAASPGNLCGELFAFSSNRRVMN